MLLLAAIIAIFLALIFYAISIFREIVQRKFTRTTLILFWIGFGFDLTGTVLMSLMSKGFALDMHAMTGLLALILMGVKALWSLMLFRKGSSSGVPKIYTLVVFLLWLGVFFMGFFKT